MSSEGVQVGGPGAEQAQAGDEIQALFDAWLEAASRKDLDAVMEPIAVDVVSYEHDAPLQYVGRETVRAVCRQGFEYMEGEFRWEVPDLRVLVSGDLAVTWGLNRMHARPASGGKIEQWSRGTRIFQKREGRWQLIHQHVSFPYDPSTGRAVVDAAPGPDR